MPHGTAFPFHFCPVLSFPSLPFHKFCSYGRSQVLRKLGMIDGEGIVTLKGRAACEIDTADELLTTEMMFNGTFNGLDKHQLVSLVSCLVPGEKSQVCDSKSLTDRHSLNQSEQITALVSCLVPGEKSQVCC
jgi:superfamily II RNA helicase